MNKTIIVLILFLHMGCSMMVFADKQKKVVSEQVAEKLQSDTTISLKDVTVLGNRKAQLQMQTSLNAISVSRNYLQTNFSGSLMQTLSGIPGVRAMSIGSSQSKPAIRGLGFNRMAVAYNGIKHEGQQWGDDHGLEIDQYEIDRIEVLKGPSALLYGSDAIGGVLNVYSNYMPSNPFQGSFSLFSRSNNESLGLSARLEGGGERFFWRSTFTFVDYADYKVPTDSIQYYSYFIKLKNRRLRNTAGKERNASLTLGYKYQGFRTDLKLSNTYSKSGYFANAHGIEVRLSDIDYDASRRDIDLPYQMVNHFRIANQTTYQATAYRIEANLGYQNNVRKEFSEPVSHGYMPKPANSLERAYRKSTYSANVALKWSPINFHEMAIGMNTEYQRNRRGGWGFIIPDFDTWNLGVYAFDRFLVSKDFILNAGLRYDRAHTAIRSYQDWFKTPVNDGDLVYKERSADLKRNFNSLTYALGANYQCGSCFLKANIGKSFRVPIAKELGADGVNYNIFRYEKGNAGLSPETSYQLDLGVKWNSKNLSFALDPYLNYFPNYIYLSPTADYLEGLQLYHYVQSEVWRWGFEMELNWKMTQNVEWGWKGEYLYAEQLSGDKKGYSLPFMPPYRLEMSGKYVFPMQKNGEEAFVEVSGRIVGRQKNIVPPEESTPGYFTLNMTAGRRMMIGKQTLRLNLHAENLFNRKYYDHTSYYRLIDVPEPGRNVALMIGLDF